MTRKDVQKDHEEAHQDSGWTMLKGIDSAELEWDVKGPEDRVVWRERVSRVAPTDWTAYVIQDWRRMVRQEQTTRETSQAVEWWSGYWSDTIWQRTAQYRLTWRRNAEAFAQPQAGFPQKSDNKIPWLFHDFPWQFTPFSMMPGRQTQTIIERIHHIHEKKVKFIFKLKIRSKKDGLPPT